MSRELDARIEQEIFGRVPCEGWQESCGGLGPMLQKGCKHAPDTCYSRIEIPWLQGQIIGGPRQFSTHIAAAWEIVDYMIGKGLLPNIKYTDNPLTRSCNWLAVVVLSDGTTVGGIGDTAPLAICHLGLEIASKL